MDKNNKCFKLQKANDLKKNIISKEVVISETHTETDLEKKKRYQKTNNENKKRKRKQGQGQDKEHYRSNNFIMDMF